MGCVFITFVADIYNFCRIIRYKITIEVIDKDGVIKKLQKAHKTIICFVY